MPLANNIKLDLSKREENQVVIYAESKLMLLYTDGIPAFAINPYENMVWIPDSMHIHKTMQNDYNFEWYHSRDWTPQINRLLTCLRIPIQIQTDVQRTFTFEGYTFNPAVLDTVTAGEGLTKLGFFLFENPDALSRARQFYEDTILALTCLQATKTSAPPIDRIEGFRTVYHTGKAPIKPQNGYSTDESYWAIRLLDGGKTELGIIADVKHHPDGFKGNFAPIKAAWKYRMAPDLKGYGPIICYAENHRGNHMTRLANGYGLLKTLEPPNEAFAAIAHGLLPNADATVEGDKLETLITEHIRCTKEEQLRLTKHSIGPTRLSSLTGRRIVREFDTSAFSDASMILEGFGTTNTERPYYHFDPIDF